MDLNDRSLGLEPGGQRTPLPIPGSAQRIRHSEAPAQQGLMLVGAGNLPVFEFRQNSGTRQSPMYASRRPGQQLINTIKKNWSG